MRTSDPVIYAVGDAVQVRDPVLGGTAMIPLAGPANRQARIAADNICGRPACYRGSQGTSIVRVFGLTAATTGASERILKRRSLPFRKVYVCPNNHVGYFPGAQSMTIKLLFHADDGRVLGAQIVGGAGVDKRIDVLAIANAEPLIVRSKDTRDGATPAGNSVALVNLLRLSLILDREDLRQKAERLMTAMGGMVSSSPLGFERLLAGVAFAYEVPTEVVIAGEASAEPTRDLLHAVQQVYDPHRLLLLARPDGAAGEADDLQIPLLANRRPVNGQPAAYVCRGGTCLRPVTAPEALSAALQGSGRAPTPTR